LGTPFGDAAYAVTAGLDGSIYVGGVTNGSLDGQPTGGYTRSYFLVKYSADGTKAWTQETAGSALGLTTGLDGSIYINGNTNDAPDSQINSGGSDAFVAKYNPDGSKAWTRLLGTSGFDGAEALTTGSDGSIYICGTTEGNLDGQTSSGGSDAFIAKYNPDGTKAWTKMLGSSRLDQARTLTSGLDGAIYISGYTEGSFDGQVYSGGGDAFISKFNSDGSKAWTKMIGTSGYEVVRAATTGLDGSIYVAGSTDGTLDGQTKIGTTDSFLIKYAVDGTKIWTKLFGPSNGGDSNLGMDARALATGPDGSIYLSGSVDGVLDGQMYSGGVDAFLTKFSVGGPQVTFAAGSPTATLVLDPVADSLTEGSETLSVTVLAGTGYSVATATATGTIVEGVANQFDAIANGDIQINGVSIGAIAAASSNSERQAQMRTALNAQTANTGVAATLDSSTGGVNLTAADGRNIEVSTLTSAAIPNRVIGIALNGSPSGTRTVTTIRSGIDLSTSNPSGITITASGGAAAATGLSSQTISSIVTTTTIPAIDISTAAGASSAIGVIDGTLDSVNSTRSTIGSYINRLNYAADNATNISTNLSASRSTIMDADYAEETANLAKSQIIQQAATAMLAQANQQPQSVMALLKNL
jgi:flagellin-like hook-associated protein FlgL